MVLQADMVVKRTPSNATAGRAVLAALALLAHVRSILARLGTELAVAMRANGWMGEGNALVLAGASM